MVANLASELARSLYRPASWFAASVAGCGGESACYHLATFAVHLLNVALAFSLALAVFRDLRVAFLGTLLFALQPAYVQAVVWISAWWLAYTACAFRIALLLVATPVTRFGALWLLGTLVPYVWFTWENVSRYLYVPSIGFGMAVAGATVALCDLLVNRLELPKIVGRAVFVLAVAFVAVRFGRFCGAAAQSQVANMEHWADLRVEAGCRRVTGRRRYRSRSSAKRRNRSADVRGAHAAMGAPKLPVEGGRSLRIGLWATGRAD